MNANLLPLVLVARSAPGDAQAGFGSDVEQTRHEIGSHQRVQFRFEHGRLDLWACTPPSNDPHGVPADGYDVDLHLAHATMTSFSECDLVFDGVETKRGRLTGRSMRVILTNADAGY